MPGSPSGGTGGIGLATLTTDLSDPHFAAQIVAEQSGALDDDIDRAGPANTQALNRYSYVQNNPLRWTDPSGHCVEVISCAAEGAAVGAAAGSAVAPGPGTAVGAGVGFVVGVLIGVVVVYVVVDAAQRAFPQSQEQSFPANEAHTKNPSWKELNPFRGQTKTNGLQGKERRYYERDRTHGDVEVYDSQGNHLGSMDTKTGEMTKPAVPGRNIKDKIK